MNFGGILPKYSKYPYQIDSSVELPITIDLVTPVKAEVVNRLRDATINIEKELGIDPSREWGTVRARLDNMELQINSLTPGPMPPPIEEGGVPTIKDKALTPAVTAGNGSYTNIKISETPKNDSYVTVMVNGIQAAVGDGLKNTECYFSATSSGLTAKKIKDIAAGDKLIWNGVNANFDLDAFDVIDLNYDI